MKTTLGISALALALLLGAGCDGGAKTTGKSTASAQPAVSAQPAASTQASTAAADSASAAPSATASAAASSDAPTTEGALTVKALQEEFAKDKAALLGKPAKVEGLYLNTNTTKAGDKTSYNIIVKANKDDKESVTCYTDTEPPQLMQWDKVLIEGKVKESFKEAALEECTIKKL